MPTPARAALLLLACLLAAPARAVRIRAVPVATARALVGRWALADSCRRYDAAAPGAVLGCVAVVDDVAAEARAVALLELDDDERLVLRDLACGDRSSATLLLSKLHRVAGSRVVVDQAEDRWRIAWQYMSE